MSSEKEILALEDARLAAQVANDTRALEGMLHDAMVYTHSSAVVDTKASFLEALRSGKTRYKRTETRFATLVTTPPAKTDMASASILVPSGTSMTV